MNKLKGIKLNKLFKTNYILITKSDNKKYCIKNGNHWMIIDTDGYIFYPSKFKTFNILEFYNQIGNKTNSVILNYKEISKVEFENLNKV